MAVKDYLETVVDTGVIVVSWAGLANGDTGQPYPLAGGFPDKSVQVTGTFGSGGSVSIEGSNWRPGEASPLYATLNDPQGNTLAVTAAKIEQVLENTSLVRPNVTAGDGTTALAVRLSIATTARK